MNLHMTRRLEVLAREIAAARAPKIDAEANAAFLINTSVKLPNGTGTFITEKDCRQLKSAATVRTVQDVLEDPTDEERDVVMKLRGGCGCGHPPHRPPCSNCETPWDEDEARVALEETSELAPQKEEAKPSAGEWIEWKGGECPIPEGAKFQYRLASRGTNPQFTAPDGRYQSGVIKDKDPAWRSWTAKTNKDDDLITAYRIVP